MARTLLDCPKPPALEVNEKAARDAHHPNTLTKRYTVDAITPIFGGGVKPAVNDPVTLIRPSSIRGHLRFWWRATRGAQCASVKDLRRREGEIWGTTEKPSSVSVNVALDKRKPGRPEACAVFPPNANLSEFKSDYPGYALFPFQGNCKKNKPIGMCTRDVRFRLTVRYPASEEKEVEAALWAWVNFGGIGARTRRGCGTLYCPDFAPAAADRIDSWLSAARARYDLAAAPKQLPWPTLGPAPLIHPVSSTPMDAWKTAVAVMQKFRQGPGVGRNGTRGRSRWPEADSLRALTGRGDPIHQESITIKDPEHKPAFPRAKLGLPIIFHFKDEPGLDKEIELSPKNATRMASPLILRPLGFGDGSRAVPMVLRLMALGPAGLRLENAGVSPALTAENISREDMATYDGSPMRNRSRRGSALEAFLRFAKEDEQGFKEVKP